LSLRVVQLPIHSLMVWSSFWIPTDKERLQNAETAILEEALAWVENDDVAYERKSVDLPSLSGDCSINTVTFFSKKARQAEDKARTEGEGGVPSSPSMQSSERAGTEKTSHLVCAHGFGAGVGLYARTMAAAVAHHGVGSVTAFDWLGFGFSSRPSFLRGSFDRADREKSESAFVSSLEAWRERMGINRMTLCGHSLGGLLCAVYAEKYPFRVRRLILASCIGLPEKPSAEESRRKGNPFASLPCYVRAVVGCIRFCWDYLNWTPLSYLRLSGPFVYHLNAQPGCGEFVLPALLDSTVHARDPLGKRVALLKAPVLFLHGEYDWVRDCTGKELQRTNPEHFRVLQLPSCGHQLFVENPKAFAAVVAKELHS